MQVTTRYLKKGGNWRARADLSRGCMRARAISSQKHFLFTAHTMPAQYQTLAKVSFYFFAVPHFSSEMSQNSAFAKLMGSAARAASSAHRKQPASTAAAAPSASSSAPGKRRSGAGELVACPMCGRNVLLSLINDHIDKECSQRETPATPALLPVSAAAAADSPAPKRSSLESSANQSVTAESLNPEPTAEAAAEGEHVQPETTAPTDTPAAMLHAAPKPPPPAARSGTVHDFFGGHDYTAPSFLVLYPESEQWAARFHRQRPAGAHLVTTAKWRGKDLILMYSGDCSPVTTAESDATPSPSLCYRGQVPLLKSHIQVCWARVERQERERKRKEKEALGANLAPFVWAPRNACAGAARHWPCLLPGNWRV